MPEGTPLPFERQIHPGSGRRKALKTPKGRQLDPDAWAEVRALLGDRPRRADLLIEHLHLIQDHYGHLAARHLRALSDEMKLPMAAIYEVASFYAHFDIVLDGETAPPPLTIRVCDSITCEMMGAQDILKALCAGCRGRPPSCRKRHGREPGRRDGRRPPSGDTGLQGLRCLSGRRRLPSAARLPGRRAPAGGADRGALPCRPAWPRRRRLPDG